MQCPEDMAVTHHEEAHPEMDEGSDSDASSGLEDASLESDDEEASMNENTEEKELVEETVEEHDNVEEKKLGAGAVGPKAKLYDKSPEWLQLKKLEDEKGVILTHLPQVIGAGVHRRPAKCFWTASYPGCSIKSASWGTRSPLECLIKCIKHAIKQHMLACPNDPEEKSWKNQLQSLGQLTDGPM